MSERFPKVTIQYCAKCKWQNRAFWYLQELLQSFDQVLLEVSLQPVHDEAGIFKVILTESSNSLTIIYQRKYKNPKLAESLGYDQSNSYFYDGFPDSKFLKLLIKQALNVELGHHIKPSETDMLTCQDCKQEEQEDN